MFEPGHNQSPFNDIPPVIVGLVAIVGLIELVFQAGAAGPEQQINVRTRECLGAMPRPVFRW